MCAVARPAAAEMAGSMPIGKRPRVPPLRGTTYLLLLFMLALVAAGAATWANRWQVALQREHETELLFRGLQLRDALQRYHDSTPEGATAWPTQLEELLADARSHPPVAHLRRLYADPFSGHPDWALLRNAQGGIVGLHSRVDRPALRRHDLPVGVNTGHGPDPKTRDWHFMATPARPTARAPGAAP
jgi:hypothetical protein